MRPLALACWVLCCLVSATPAAGIPITFHKIADTSTPIPDGTGNFTQLLEATLDGSRVAFRGLGASSQIGIYHYDGSGLHKVVARGDPRWCSP